VSALREPGSWCRSPQGACSVGVWGGCKVVRCGLVQKLAVLVVAGMGQVVGGGSFGGQPVLVEADMKLKLSGVCASGFCWAEEHHGVLR